ncbi:MAG: response regulator [Planctomycetota bacterium]
MPGQHTIEGQTMSGNNGTNGHKNGKAAEPAEDLHDKQVFTTGEAAEVCKVSQQTIIRCFDAGRLKGFRVPGSRFRRIPREELIRFMKANEIPTDAFNQGKKKILVVDDDPQIVDLFKDVLGSNDRYELQSAGTGYEAGLLTTEFKPDLMILDYMLPDINGNMVCKTVRENPKLGSMKILIVSGVVNREEIDDLLSSGADDFIKKPFDLEELMARVESLIEA